jgi:hypothetical protein
MIYVKRYPVYYPAVETGVWTKITRIKDRKFFSMWNTDVTHPYRFLVLPYDSDSAEVNSIYSSTDGLIIAPSADANNVGGGVQEDEVISVGDFWVYQSSGGQLKSLAVDEGV